MTNKCKFRVGQKVNILCMTSMGSDSIEVVAEVNKKFDEDTGKPYQVIVTQSGHKFDGRTLNAISPPMLYYIET